jgi:hypothetical protein
MRPVVILMLLATVLFVLDGLIDHYAAPDQPFFEEYKGVGWTSFVFAIANLLMTIAVARGSERTLLGRIALSAFFIVERPLTAFVLGPKPVTAIAVHLLTALVEVVILLGALRVWRLGHSLVAADVDAALALDRSGPGAVAVVPPAPKAPAVAVVPPKTAWQIGGLTLLLAAILVADGIVAGYIPGGPPWGLSAESSGWLAYLLAVVLLIVSTRAVHGHGLTQRLLLVLALITFIERAFGPFALRVVDPVRLGLHGLAAFAALALALATANAIRVDSARVAVPPGTTPAS